MMLGEEGLRYVHSLVTIYCGCNDVEPFECCSHDCYLISYSSSMDDKMNLRAPRG
jgi:hypothetical protein